MTDAQNQLRKEYITQRSLVSSFSGFQLLGLWGMVETTTWVLQSQDNLIVYASGVVLPRLFVLNFPWSEQMLRRVVDGNYDSAFLHQYFLKFLVEGLQSSYELSLPYHALPLSQWLREHFGLSCLEGVTQHSFVCSSYVNQFLKTFSMFDLAKTEEEIKEAPSFAVRDDFFEIYEYLKADYTVWPKVCQWVLQYLQYGGKNDDRFSQIFHSCGSEMYNQYVFLRDFLLLTESLRLGYLDSKVYGSSSLNHYKLFSLQQLLYKRLLAVENAEPLLQAYLGFLYEILTREGNKGITLLDQFSKDFTYWYNSTILLPYLRDENSKLSKDIRTNLISKLLVIDNGNKSLNVVGLTAQTTLLKPKISSTTSDQQEQKTLEELFRASIPSQFRLTALTRWEQDEKLLIVEGVDQPTQVALKAYLKFDAARFYVDRIEVADTPSLEEFVNAILQVDRYNFVKMLWLLADNRAIAEQNQALSLDFCEIFSAKYPNDLLTCSSEQIRMLKWETEQSSGTVYTFGLEKGRLKSIELSDKVLETQLLKEIDFSTMTQEKTLHMIPFVLDFVAKDHQSGFGLKEQLLVNDKFVKYFKQAPKKVDIVGGIVKVYFTLQNINFIGTYDIATHRLAPIALDFGGARSPVIIQKMELYLVDTAIEDLNRFVLTPLKYLQSINANLVKRYFKDGVLKP